MTLREKFPEPEESIICDLEDEGFMPANHPITDLLVSLLIHIVPPKVTYPECHFLRRAMMEATSATSFGSPHTPISISVGGGVMALPPPPPIRTTTVQKPTILGSGTVPSTTLTIVPSIQNMSSAPFSYGMSGFDSILTLTYFTLQTIGLGEWSSNATLHVSFMGTTSLFNTIHYSGIHIPPPSPSLGGAFQ